MLTESWTPLRYHEKQSKLWRCTDRLVAVAAGRGSGKTEISRRRVVRMLPVKKPWVQPLYFYALPTVSQARRVAWEQILNLIPQDWLAKDPNKSEMSIETKFGSKLYILGLDKPMRAEGVQYDGGIIDESCDQKPGVFDRTFLPALTHHNGWCWRIGVPKRFGIGAKEFREFFNRPDVRSFTWPSWDILDDEYIRQARQAMDPRDFDEQFGAAWQTTSGMIFYNFDRSVHVSREATYSPNETIIVGSDFNVNPMAWVLCHLRDGVLHTFDELWIRNTTTRETLDILYKKYGNHAAGFSFFGDAASGARHTSASTTDYIQIKNDQRFSKMRIYYPKKNPLRTARFAACTYMLRDAENRVRWKIHPKCVNLINDLEDRAYKAGTREPDDYGDIGHITDAAGYIIHRLFPVSYKPPNTSPEVHVSNA